MKFMSLLVAFCFSMNVFAQTGALEGFEKAVDEYQYALTVEWDQKDAKFYDAQTTAFFTKLQKLMKEEGLTQQQVLDLAEKKMNNKEAFAALKLKMSVLSQVNSKEELLKVIKESSNDFYAQGASWNGSVVVPVIAGLVVVGIIGYVVWWEATHECVAWDYRYVCNSYNHCYGGYYDSYGYYGGYCGGGYYTSCGWANVCTQYAKKD